MSMCQLVVCLLTYVLFIDSFIDSFTHAVTPFTGRITIVTDTVSFVFIFAILNRFDKQ